MMLAAGGILAAIAAGVWLLKESSTPLARDTDARAGENVEADADAKADADADAHAEAKAEVRDSATTASAPVRDAGLETVGKPPTEVGVKAAGTVNLDEGSDGKTIDLAKGQSVVLMLSATPSSGFDWAVTKAPAALGSPGMGFIAGGGDQMGASGKRRIAWTLKDALPAGEHTVELGYARGFEPGVAPFKTFRFKVRAAR